MALGCSARHLLLRILQNHGACLRYQYPKHNRSFVLSNSTGYADSHDRDILNICPIKAASLCHPSTFTYIFIQYPCTASIYHEFSEFHHEREGMVITRPPRIPHRIHLHHRVPYPRIPRHALRPQHPRRRMASLPNTKRKPPPRRAHLRHLRNARSCQAC